MFLDLSWYPCYKGLLVTSQNAIMLQKMHYMITEICIKFIIGFHVLSAIGQVWNTTILAKF